MSSRSMRRKNPGVFIVGAGPGASDLITVRGLRLLKSADVVFYDALIDFEMLGHARRGARLIFVGKRCGSKAMEQPEINRRMIDAARSGKVAVRLKGGDPYLFGRGGEEALACSRAGVHFEVAPGVSSALGAASHAGIPLTYRDAASSVAFVTARDCDDANSLSALTRAAQAVDTLVIFMGGLRLKQIKGSLLAGGLSPQTAVAVVSQATLRDQRTVYGVLDGVEELVHAAGLSTPMLIIVGKVVALGAVLNWFERRKSEDAWESSDRPDLRAPGIL